MKHWRIDNVAWDRFEPAKVDPSIVPLVKAAAVNCQLSVASCQTVVLG